MKPRICILAMVLLLVCVGGLFAREQRRRDLGDVVGNQSQDIRDSLDDLMECLTRSVSGSSLSDSDVAALMLLGQLEGHLAVLSALSRNGRTQAYNAVAEAIAKSAEEAGKALRASRTMDGMARSDWLRIQMDLRQIEMNVRKTGPSR